MQQVVQNVIAGFLDWIVAHSAGALIALVVIGVTKAILDAVRYFKYKRLKGYWIEYIKNNNKCLISIGEFYFRVRLIGSSKWYYGGTNYNNDGSIRWSWDCLKLHIDANGFIYYIYYLSPKHDSKGEGFGYINASKLLTRKEVTPITGYFLDAHTNMQQQDTKEVIKKDVVMMKADYFEQQSGIALGKECQSHPTFVVRVISELNRLRSMHWFAAFEGDNGHVC